MLFSIFYYFMPTIILVMLSFVLVGLGQLKFFFVCTYKFSIRQYFYSVVQVFLILCGILAVIDLTQISYVDSVKMIVDSITINLSSSTSNVGAPDPRRFFPSYWPSQFGIIGSGVYVYNRVQGPPKVKAIAAVSALGISSAVTFYTMALDYPIGFNSYMYTVTEYMRTGLWPN